MLSIQNCQYLNDYLLLLTFSNGENKVVDLKQRIFEGGEIFQPLKDIDYFRTVQMDEEKYTICWENGADLAPEFLYENAKSLEEKRASSDR